MQLTVKQANPATLKTACLIVAVYERNKLSPSATALDEVAGNFLARSLKRGDLAEGDGKTLLLLNVPNVAAERVLLTRCAKPGAKGMATVRKAVAAAIDDLDGRGARDVALYLGDWSGAQQDAGATARVLAETCCTQVYRFDELKSKKPKSNRPLSRATLIAAGAREASAARRGAQIGQAIAAGVNLARDLANRPANICTPTHLAEQARELKRGNRKLKVEVLGEKQMRELGMGSLLSVASGSRQEAKLIVFEYRAGGARQKPVVLVGKGVTFDTGGISIKPAAAMDEMKFDMCGAASVFGTVKACLELDLEVNLVGLVPATENMPDGQATRPGDIVTSMSGQTIEILNTDAEGRLILCDALSYAERYDPSAVIDIATLTGACVIALGEHASGLLSNDDKLAQRLLAAGQASGDRCWQLPLWDDYQEQLKSNFADMSNIGGRAAGTITAACFLARFTEKYRWAHLDIAGTAWLGGTRKGATGRPVPLLVHYLLEH